MSSAQDSVSSALEDERKWGRNSHRAFKAVTPRANRDRRTGGEKARNLLHKIKADTRIKIMTASDEWTSFEYFVPKRNISSFDSLQRSNRGELEETRMNKY